MTIQVCDDCLNIAYDMGIEPETQAAVMVKMGAVLDDHICIKREDTGLHCDCDCNNH